MSGLPREVWKWLQSLRLTTLVRNTRRDFANGHVIAEILARYYPDEVSMHSYHTGTALDKKLANWGLLQKLFKQKDIAVPREYIDGTIHCKPGAAEPLVCMLYAALTHRKSNTVDETGTTIAFHDLEYQASLPAYARATAAYALKNNLKPTELKTAPNREVVHGKAETIIANQRRLKDLDRTSNPDRYGIRQLKSTGHRVMTKSKNGTQRRPQPPTEPPRTPPRTLSRPNSASRTPDLVEVTLRQSVK